MPAGSCPHPPGPGGFAFRGRWGPAPRLPLLPPCLLVALRCCPVCWRLLLSRTPPRVFVSRVSSPCCSFSSVPPLPSPRFPPLAFCSPPHSPGLCFLGVVALPPVFHCPAAAALFFPVPLALAPDWLGFFFPSRLAAIHRSVRCVLVLCPRLPPGGCSWWCAVPRVLLSGTAVGCGLFCAARGSPLCWNPRPVQ